MQYKQKLYLKSRYMWTTFLTSYIDILTITFASFKKKKIIIFACISFR